LRGILLGVIKPGNEKYQLDANIVCLFNVRLCVGVSSWNFWSGRGDKIEIEKVVFFFFVF